MSDETTLALCPFCGGEAEMYSSCEMVIVECKKCYVHSKGYTSEEKAIAAWNTRAPVEHDGWFYLPKPKESIVEYGEPCIKKTKNGYKMRQPVDVIDDAIRSWGDELGEHVMKRICEVWSARATHGTLTAEQVREAIENHGTASLGCRWQFTDRNLQAIADELNGTLGSGTCDAIVDKDYYRGINGVCEGIKCSNCEEPLSSKFKHCPWCGARIRKAVER